MKPSPRLTYLLLALATIVAGLASRRFAAYLPGWFAEYGGDTLWGLMVYWLVSLVLAERPFALGILHRSAIALVFAFGIEFSQLYQAPWINRLRETKLGGLLLGFGFLPTDLLCYVVGISVGALTEQSFSNFGRADKTT
jgi:hypothetical protein